MSDLHCSAGPVSSMPGSSHRLPEGTMCDQHPEHLAVRRVQGETDSFGCEYICMCQECVDANNKYAEERQNVESYCEWGKHMGKHVLPYRDMDEGMAGPVYQTCKDCRQKDHEHWAAEAMESDTGDDFFDDDSDRDIEQDDGYDYDRYY